MDCPAVGVFPTQTSVSEMDVYHTLENGNVYRIYVVTNHHDEELVVMFQREQVPSPSSTSAFSMPPLVRGTSLPNQI
eukprot:scaffold6090_cov168-Amphora_coffeaeformis.AAC.1